MGLFMAKVQRLQYGVNRIENGGWVVLEDGDATGRGQPARASMSTCGSKPPSPLQKIIIRPEAEVVSRRQRFSGVALACRAGQPRESQNGSQRPCHRQEFRAAVTVAIPTTRWHVNPHKAAHLRRLRARRSARTQCNRVIGLRRRCGMDPPY